MGFGQSQSLSPDPCDDPIPPELGADYDDNCWAYSPDSSGAMFTKLWEKTVEVDCPVLEWDAGTIEPLVLCAKV